MVTWNRPGRFYMIQLVPDLKPGRIKFGWTERVERRWMSHMVAAPTARIFRDWGCPRSWEQYLIAVATGGCEQISSEVFDCPDLFEIVIRLDQLFIAVVDFDGYPPPKPKRKHVTTPGMEMTPYTPLVGLKALRIRYGLDMKQLAKMTGVDWWRIHALEKGTADLGPATMEKFAQFFGVRPCDLVMLDEADALGVKVDDLIAE